MPIVITGLDALVSRFAAIEPALARPLAATIGTDVPYAALVVAGTRAHDILPRNRRALFWPGAAHPVARVRHPGTKANPFLSDAAAAREGDLAAAMGAVAAGILAGTRPPSDLRQEFARGVEEVAHDARSRIHSVTGRLAGSVTVEVHA